MATVDVAVPPFPSFTDEHVQLTIASFFSNHELIPLFHAFCSNQLAESEHDLLLNNSALVCPEAVKAAREIAVRANSVNDVNTAYFFHRKAEVLSACLEHGVTGFFARLNDPLWALDFFELIGPPPGYSDDYWNQLIDTYKDGEHLNHQFKRQQYPGVNNTELWQSEDLLLPVADMPASFVNDVKTLLSSKYQLSPSEDQQSLQYVLSLDPRTTTALQSQFQERSMLIQEFVQTGMPTLLNWINAMSPTTRFTVLEQCIEDVVLASPLDAVLSLRQRRSLLPELCDVAMLVGSGPDNLQHLLVRIASGSENDFAEVVEGVHEAQVASTSYLERFDLAAEADRITILKEMDRWAKDLIADSWYNVPVLLNLEHSIETALTRFFLPASGAALLTPELEHFIMPFKLYRTRGLQLFALAVIERCLKHCLPPPQQSGQSKKRKRPM